MSIILCQCGQLASPGRGDICEACLKVKVAAKRAREADLLATAEKTGQYACTTCMGLWKPEEILSEHEEKEGCPDCLHECERCGDLIDCHGTFEHCL